MYINKAQIYGNLTRDPEVKALPSGIKVASFSVATNRVWKDKDGNKKDSTEYHNVVVFGKPADLISQYMKKGNPIFVEGRLQTRSWDGADGQKRYRTEIICDNFQFGPKSSSTGGSYANKSNEDTQVDEPSPKKSGSSDEIAYPEEEINIEDIPF